MKIARPAFILGSAIFFLLFLSPGAAHSQSIPPRAYLFVDVSDTEGKAVKDATLTLTLEDGSPFRYEERTDENGVAKTIFENTSEHHYNLKVSKQGYLPSDHVFYVYPAGEQSDRRTFYAVEDFPLAPQEFKSSEPPRIKVVLLRTPVTEAERRAAVAEERKRQLVLAAKRADAASLRKLLQAGVKADAVDDRGVPAIAWAAFAGYAEPIKELLAARANVRNKKTLGHQALLIYLSDGISREKYTYRYPRNYNAVPDKHLLEQREDVVRWLVEAGAGVNVRNSFRGSVLNRAIMLTPQSPHSRANAQMGSPLSVNIVRELIAARASVVAPDADGLTPLMAAAQMHSIEVIRMLFKAGARSSINAKDKKGQTALIYAVPQIYSDSLPEIFKLLIDAGGDVNAVNAAGQTALMLAAEVGAIEEVELLLASGARAFIGAKDKEGRTALMYSSKPRHYGQPLNAEISRILIQAGALVNDKDAQGLTALMYSSKTPVPEGVSVARVLIQSGASVNEKDAKGMTALMYASPKYYNDSSAEVVRVLIAAGADVNAVNEEGQTALMLAARWFDANGVRMLIGAGADINARDKLGQTVLMHAAQAGGRGNVGLFIGAGASPSVNAKDAKGMTALMYAASSYYSAKDVAALIAAGARVNEVNEDGQTALMMAVPTGSLELVKTLMDSGAGASVNVKDKQGQTAIMKAASSYNYMESKTVVKLLIDAGGDVNVVDNEGRTALMASASKGTDAIAELLLEAGARFDVTDKKGQTALMIAREAGQWSIVSLLERAARLR